MLTACRIATRLVSLDGGELCEIGSRGSKTLDGDCTQDDGQNEGHGRTIHLELLSYRDPYRLKKGGYLQEKRLVLGTLFRLGKHWDISEIYLIGQRLKEEEATIIHYLTHSLSIMTTTRRNLHRKSLVPFFSFSDGGAQLFPFINSFSGIDF